MKVERKKATLMVKKDYIRKLENLSIEERKKTCMGKVPSGEKKYVMRCLDKARILETRK